MTRSWSTAYARPSSLRPSGVALSWNFALWALQAVLALMFAMAGFAKVGGDAAMVEMFATIGIGQWQVETNDRPAPWRRTQAEPCAQEVRDPPHDRKAQTHALLAIPLHIAQLDELLEDPFAMLGRDAGPGVLDGDDHGLAFHACGETDFSGIGVAHRVGKQVADEPLQQASVGAHVHRGEVHPPGEALGRALRLVLRAERGEHVLQRGSAQ